MKKKSEYQKKYRKTLTKQQKKRIAKKVKEYYLNNKDRLDAIKAQQYKERKDYVWNYKLSHPCVVCGESDPIVLEFDHLDPNEKEATIANMLGRSASLEKIQKEINKCQILCANCHRRKHFYDKGNH